jgi:hypothetical protein
MDGVPSFWTLLPGVIAGCLLIGRVGQWIQLLLSASGIDPARPFTKVRPAQMGPLILATVAHPMPWIILIGTALGVRRLLGGPIAAEWTWFFWGFFCGPMLIVAVTYFRIARAIRKQSRESAPPPS